MIIIYIIRQGPVKLTLKNIRPRKEDYFYLIPTF